MIREVWLGARQALRRWPTTVAFMAMVGVGGMMCLAMMASLLQISAQVSALSRLGGLSATYFSAFYLSAATVNPDKSPELDELWSGMVNDGIGFSAVVGNPPTGVPSDIRVVIVTGVMPAALGDWSSQLGLGQAMIGADVVGHQVGEVIKVGEQAVRIEGQMSPGGLLPDPSGWFDPSLDTSVVVRLAPSDLSAMGAIQFEEAVSRTVLIDAPQQRIDAFVGATATAGMQLVPKSVDADGLAVRRTGKATATRLLGLFGGMVGLVVVGFGMRSVQVARASRQTLAIQRLCGATLGQLAVREATYIGLTTALPFLLVVGVVIGMVPGYPYAGVAAGALGGVGLLVWVALTGWVVWEIARVDLSESLREGEET